MAIVMFTEACDTVKQVPVRRLTLCSIRTLEMKLIISFHVLVFSMIIWAADSTKAIPYYFLMVTTKKT